MTSCSGCQDTYSSSLGSRSTGGCFLLTMGHPHSQSLHPTPVLGIRLALLLPLLVLNLAWLVLPIIFNQPPASVRPKGAGRWNQPGGMNWHFPVKFPRMDTHTELCLCVDAVIIMPLGLITKWPSSEFYFWYECWTVFVLQTESWSYFLKRLFCFLHVCRVSGLLSWGPSIVRFNNSKASDLYTNTESRLL